MPTAARSYVYFVRCPHNGLIKVGWTACHPDSRLASLRAGSPVALEPVAVIPDADADFEASLHRRFDYLCDHHEWFRPGDELLEFIAEDGEAWPSPEGRRAWPPRSPVPSADRLADELVDEHYRLMYPANGGVTTRLDRFDRVLWWRSSIVRFLRTVGLDDETIAGYFRLPVAYVARN